MFRYRNVRAFQVFFELKIVDLLPPRIDCSAALPPPPLSAVPLARLPPLPSPSAWAPAGFPPPPKSRIPPLQAAHVQSAAASSSSPSPPPMPPLPQSFNQPPAPNQSAGSAPLPQPPIAGRVTTRAGQPSRVPPHARGPPTQQRYPARPLPQEPVQVAPTSRVPTRVPPGHGQSASPPSSSQSTNLLPPTPTVSAPLPLLSAGRAQIPAEHPARMERGPPPQPPRLAQPSCQEPARGEERVQFAAPTHAQRQQPAERTRTVRLATPPMQLEPPPANSRAPLVRSKTRGFLLYGAKQHELSPADILKNDPRFVNRSRGIRGGNDKNGSMSTDDSASEWNDPADA